MKHFLFATYHIVPGTRRECFNNDSESRGKEGGEAGAFDEADQNTDGQKEGHGADGLHAPEQDGRESSDGETSNNNKFGSCFVQVPPGQIAGSDLGDRIGGKHDGQSTTSARNSLFLRLSTNITQSHLIGQRHTTMGKKGAITE